MSELTPLQRAFSRSKAARRVFREEITREAGGGYWAKLTNGLLEQQTIAEAIEGRTITGAEPIDYPLTDGLIISLTGRSGRQLALEIGADPDADPAEGNPFYINLAAIPQTQEAQRL